jgi:hypothetical protein
MIRRLYCCLIRLHPSRFRERYAAEMLEIFDESKGPSSFRVLMADAFISLIRQWLLRKRAWAGFVAAVLAGLEFWFLGLMYHFPAFVLKRMPAANQAATSTEMRLLIIVSAAGVVLLAGAASFQALTLLRASRRTALRSARASCSKSLLRTRPLKLEGIR